MFSSLANQNHFESPTAIHRRCSSRKKPGFNEHYGCILHNVTTLLWRKLLAYHFTCLACLIIENLRRSIFHPDVYADAADRLDLAIKQYDQALILLMFGKSADVLVPTCRSSNRDEIASEAT